MPKKSTWTEEDIAYLFHKRDVEKKIWRVIGSELGRSTTAVQWKYEIIRHPREATPKIPIYVRCEKASEETIRERNYRVNLFPTDLTAAFFNDPKPGYSALDKRRALA